MFTRRPLLLSIEQQCTARLNIIITARLNHQMLARSLHNNVTVLFSLVIQCCMHVFMSSLQVTCPPPCSCAAWRWQHLAHARTSRSKRTNWMTKWKALRRRCRSFLICRVSLLDTTDFHSISGDKSMQNIQLAAGNWQHCRRSRRRCKKRQGMCQPCMQTSLLRALSLLGCACADQSKCFVYN